MQVGEVRAADDADFEHLRMLCTRHDDWRQVGSWRRVSLATLPRCLRYALYTCFDVADMK